MDRGKINEHQRIYRLRTGNLCTKKYEKTHKGFLMRLYRNMESRVKGIQKKNLSKYIGKEIISRDEFYKWALNSDTFYSLFKSYEDSGFTRRLSPSIDRIDSSRGYSIDNIRWLTMSENSRLGSINNPNKLKVQIYNKSEFLGSFKSIKEASDKTGINYYKLYNRFAGIVGNGSDGIFVTAV